MAVDFALQVLTVQDTLQAKIVYNRARQLPGTSTKLIAKEQGIIINGDYLPNMPSKSALVYAFQGTTPLILKVPRDEGAAEHESSVWQQLGSGGTPPHLAGPVTLLNLQVGCRSSEPSSEFTVVSSLVSHKEECIMVEAAERHYLSSAAAMCCTYIIYGIFTYGLVPCGAAIGAAALCTL